VESLNDSWYRNPEHFSPAFSQGPGEARTRYMQEVPHHPPPSPDAEPGESSHPLAPRWSRALWVLAGLAGCGLGFLGLLLPGMPATVFFLIAAACFSKSSPRLLRWVLQLPRVGPMVRDYRAGKGMPRSAKVTATVMMLGFGGVSVWVVEPLALKAFILALLSIGAWVIWKRVPLQKNPSPTARPTTATAGTGNRLHSITHNPSASHNSDGTGDAVTSAADGRTETTPPRS
jgi:uncharacterized protein